MSAGDLAIGLDLGTSGLKALALDAAGRVVATATRAYPLHCPKPNWAEQDPQDWWRAAVEAVGELRAAGVQADRVAAIGLSGQMHGLVLLGADNEPLLPCQTWADARCSAEAAEIEGRVGRDRLRALAGSAANTSATAAKLLWVRSHLPEVYARARRVVLPKDYLRLRLTGTWATDPTDASGTLLCDVAARAWSAELLDALEIASDLLPPIVPSWSAAGHLSDAAAHELGLQAGLPVIAGAGDAEAAALGMGLVGAERDAGWALASLGTAGQFFAVTRAPLVDATGRLQSLCHAAPERWHVMSAILMGASALAWLAGAVSGTGSRAPVADLLAEAGAVPPGADGLLFLPHLHGLRLPEADPAVAGAFVGLRPEHGRGALARAVVEGVALALRDGLVAARELGIAVERVRLAGAANRAPLWAQVQADVFGVPVEVGASEDASALGAALLAGSATGMFATLDAAAQRVSGASARYDPRPESAQRYKELHAIMRDAQHGLRATFAALDSYRHRVAY